MTRRADLRPVAVTRPRSAAADRARPRSAEGRPWRLNAEGDDTAELLIFDRIGFWGVEAEQFAGDVAALGDRPLHVRVNSPGGDVFDGLAIYNTLLQYPGAVTTTVEGLAASAASFIALAADEVRVMRASQVMIHDAWGLAIGPAAEMREMGDVLDGISDLLADTYQRRAGTGTATTWRDAMRAETWYRDGAAAVDAGLADVVVDPPRGRPDDDGAENAWLRLMFADAEPTDRDDGAAAAAARARRARALAVRHLALRTAEKG